MIYPYILDLAILKTFIILNRDNKLIFIDGPAGTAKTYCAVLAALKLLQRKSFKSILYLRSIAECSTQKLGALPGELHEKIGPFGEIGRAHV